MSSQESELPTISTSQNKSKRGRKSYTIPLEYGQRCIASSMAKIVNSMVNKELQKRCKELLEMEDISETEARILFILQQIEREREEEENLKKENKKQRLKKRLEKQKEDELN